MTYHVGQLVELSTSLAGTGTAPTMTLTVTKPDGTTTSPALVRTDTASGWTWKGSLTVTAAGDYLYVFTSSGSYIGVDDGQFHVIASALRIVGLSEVKEHGNIVGTGSDRELLNFITTAQEMIEGAVGSVVPATYTAERHRSGGYRIWLDHTPVLSITAVEQYNNAAMIGAVAAGLWQLDPSSGSLARVTTAGTYTYFAGTEVAVTYRAGRSPIPEAIRWAAMELTIHLWRSTQTMRQGRSRGEGAETAAGYGMPNRVREALAPYLLTPGVV
jgi:hypothetical protein